MKFPIIHIILFNESGDHFIHTFENMGFDNGIANQGIDSNLSIKQNYDNNTNQNNEISIYQKESFINKIINKFKNWLQNIKKRLRNQKYRRNKDDK